MTYPHLPPVGSLTLPELPLRLSPNRSSRNGRRARLAFSHVWGGGSFDGVEEWLCKGDSKPGANDGSQASSHGIYAGEVGPDAGRAVQLVPWTEKAWTECELNPVGISFEFADAIWQGHDPEGFARAARIIAGLCHFHLDACHLVDPAGIIAGSHGFTYHLSAGALGCGHLSCPTTNVALRQQFAERVVAEYRHGGFRTVWGI